jgi:hypothetical protein
VVFTGAVTFGRVLFLLNFGIVFLLPLVDNAVRWNGSRGSLGTEVGEGGLALCH